MKIDKDLISDFFKRFSNLKFVKDATEQVLNTQDNITIKYLRGSSAPIFLSALWNNIQSPLLILVNDDQTAKDWYHDIKLVLGEDNLAIFLSHKKAKHAGAIDMGENPGMLVDGLNKALNQKNPIIITTPNIFDIKIPKPSAVQANRITVSCGDVYNFEEFTNSLLLNGFQREDYVYEPGEVAVRGGILDVFPVGMDNPIRIEFFGNEIDSIREFEPLSQRSIRERSSVEFINNLFEVQDENSLSVIYDYLNENTIAIVNSPEEIDMSDVVFDQFNNFRRININSLGDADIVVKSELQPGYNSSIVKLNEALTQLVSYKTHIYIGSESKIHAKRIKELVENSFEEKEETDDITKLSPIKKEEFFTALNWVDESFSTGFLLSELRLAFLCEHQIFGRRRITDRNKNKSTTGITLRELKRLNIGDYVVHEDKGVGRFDGFQTIDMGGSRQDCMRMIFAEGDVLYVHLNYIHKVSKFSAQEGVSPKLTKLGSSEWMRKKEKTKRKLKDIARDLITLYAERKSAKGYSYPSDTNWQKEFEASFYYEDTPDQARTTEEVKRDMESDSPMDRLVCGDVGFGKTEIAVRAAFKAAQSGKQVAVLCPTTILAQQHYQTFSDRIGRYPIAVEVLSRFKSKKEQDIVIEKLKKGQVDIVIGTHRLLSKDVAFKDLGMLVIDEEHRFGVGSKEKLRQIRANVDTLTLTATPIPRTLNFSLMGARDMSLIETPPRNRLPVETEIIDWSDEYIVSIIKREISRGGQIFFVNDKVQDLDKIAQHVQMLIPSIKYGLAHGQMPPAEIEKVMEKFVERKIDILYATKIVESGIDIPNANTMFINNAKNFGLAELYQLRGRVGRADIQAYCYLVVKGGASMPTKAIQRLQAIEEFTDLGSGFKLAMRDFEIRGAGNLLGPEQSGYINEIGFETYQKVLDEAVREIRRDEFSDVFADSQDLEPLFFNEDIAIELDTDALFPSNYIEKDTDRFDYYKKLYNVRTNKELHEVFLEIEDRYGKAPAQAKELYFAVQLRVSALNTGLTRIIVKPNRMVAEFPPETNELYYQIAFPHVIEYINTLPNAALKQTKQKLLLEVGLNKRSEAAEVLWKIKKTIELIEID